MGLERLVKSFVCRIAKQKVWSLHKLKAWFPVLSPTNHSKIIVSHGFVDAWFVVLSTTIVFSIGFNRFRVSASIGLGYRV